MTNPLRYIHTHGKVARCWPTGFWLWIYYVVNEEPHPTATLDYLVQRCEEEGVNFRLSTYFEDGHCCATVYDLDGYRVGHAGADKHSTPQEALLTALARALGWEGE
jgi:hypothetical protein